MRISRTGLLDRLEARGTPSQRLMLAAVRHVASDLGMPIYLVGGSVRDLLLQRHAIDLDITVEGDAIALAHAVTARLSVPGPVAYPTFRTATIHNDTTHLDLITARREVYPHPGALPVVTPAGLIDDLARRDFTVNAIALGLAGEHVDQLIDPFHGVEDLRRRQLRILAPHSFRDDATRLLRAARYAARFRLRLDSTTSEAALRDRGFLSAISPARVRHELLRIFDEARPVAALARIRDLALPEILLPGLRFTNGTLGGWRRLTPEQWSQRLMPWAIPALPLPERLHSAYIDRFALTHSEARVVRALPLAQSRLTCLARGAATPSAIVAALDGIPTASIESVVVAAPHSRRGMLGQAYLATLRRVKPILDAEEIKRMGVPQGPFLGDVLRALRAAVLDGAVLTLDDERALVQHMVEEHTGV